MNQLQHQILQTESTQRMNLSKRAELIQCSKCIRDPKKVNKCLFINSLNISKNTLLGDRLLCQQCEQISLNTLHLDKAEEYLEQWKEDQEMRIQTKKNQFQKIEALIKETSSMLLKTWNQQLENVGNIIKSYNEMLKSELIKQTQLDKMIQEVNTFFGQTSLQKLAEYFSQQNIEEGRLIRKLETDSNQVSTIFESVVYLQEKMGKILRNEQQKQKIDEILSDYKLNNISLYQQLMFKEVEMKVETKGKANLNVTAVAIKQGNQYIAIGFSNGVIMLWKQQQRIWNQQFGQDRMISNLVFSHKEQLFAASYMNYIYLYNFRDLSKISEKKIITHDDDIQKIIFCNNSDYLFSCSDDNTVKIVKLQNYEIVQNIPLANPIGIGISQDNQYLSFCTKEQIYLYNCANLNCLTQIAQLKRTRRLTGIAFSSKYLMTCGDEITIFNLDLLIQQKQFEIIKIIKCDQCWDIKVINDKYIIVNDGEIKIWNLNTDELIYKQKILQKNKQLQFVNYEKAFDVSQDMKLILIGSTLLIQQ